MMPRVLDQVIFFRFMPYHGTFCYHDIDAGLGASFLGRPIGKQAAPLSLKPTGTIVTRLPHPVPIP